ncbi:hypothetical protein BOTBODRAFT_205673 [Botryobasidium botryosum FD-172 SS1]|uniref:Uncharacterized protein n=1 Tax=Botryobasidium botryosum (strain FD-172 SS1) TaxID=930990 RepID=A0A067N0J1_BOTB1|nr:hypothetical protein BOTBODRAFT_205673 [Botryobasidium botryosum FD-172 SS1]
MTSCLIKSLIYKPYPTYRQLLSDLTKLLNSCKRRPKEAQTAQLHASHPLRLDECFIL